METSNLKTVALPIRLQHIQKAILRANAAPPHARENAWKYVFKLSNEYKKKEDLEMKSK